MSYIVTGLTSDGKLCFTSIQAYEPTIKELEHWVTTFGYSQLLVVNTATGLAVSRWEHEPALREVGL